MGWVEDRGAALFTWDVGWGEGRGAPPGRRSLRFAETRSGDPKLLGSATGDAKAAAEGLAAVVSAVPPGRGNPLPGLAWARAARSRAAAGLQRETKTAWRKE